MNAVAVLAAVVASAAVGWLGLYGFAWNDYEVEALPAVNALVHGRVLAFLQLAPAYGGSLVERAPFALLPGLWGGGELAVYRTLALPCLLAAAALGVWLAADARRRGRGALAQALVLGVCVANPLTLYALELGHPEELLGGALCVAAVLLAARGRPAWAGVLLGAAVANKSWAVLAVGPVLLALPSRRALCAAVACTVAAAVLAPLVLVGSSGFVAATRAVASTSSAIFQPWQDWWFFAHHGAAVHGLFGAVKPGYRTAPAWIGRVSHPLIVALSLPLSALLWWRRRGLHVDAVRRERDALGLLALSLLLRCALDTWDVVYYALPFVLALLAWETAGARRLALFAPASTALAWAQFEWLPAHASADVQAAVFLALTTPSLAALALWLYAPGRAERLCERARRVCARRALPAVGRAFTRPRSAPWAAR